MTMLFLMHWRLSSPSKFDTPFYQMECGILAALMSYSSVYTIASGLFVLRTWLSSITVKGKKNAIDLKQMFDNPFSLCGPFLGLIRIGFTLGPCSQIFKNINRCHDCYSAGHSF
ncbi:hypothetical protein SISSUDRAFT_683982 [Sistotremastrum suecicum HHB10207 ss-3]|uniref:Uncharacterized protein n=1 Tax=Sistotremastrum suecicum HHB10207 ss-3 TaxID=1314776 RepID=A0A166I1I5_9AGAM|nr:hypothetical protein SISSUDRAFT_683982 [Sistotremastrum suecicum HHB10207 ss-3]